MDGITDYLKNALATNQASALSFVQAFGTATVTEIDAFWRQLVSEAEATAIEVTEHEIVKAADSAGFALPNDPRLLPGLPTPLVDQSFTPIKPRA